MGCASSKRIDTKVSTDVYKPLPSSFAVFDINSIQEPWLLTSADGDEEKEEEPEKPPPPSAAVIDKISKFETLAADDAPPRSWDEVSKALATTDYFTPKQPAPPPATSPTQPPAPSTPPAAAPPPKKSASFHTLEELDRKLKAPPATPPEKTVSGGPATLRAVSLRKTELPSGGATGGRSTIKENPFIVRDRVEMEKEGKLAAYDRMMSYKRDPLAGYPERCPPGGESSLVVYTTSLRGVRRTHEDCARVRSILEGHRVVFDERDVSLDAGFLGELRGLLEGEGGSGGGVPRVFLKGRDLGGVEEVVDLNETGRLGRMLGWAKIERGLGWRACEGCGGARFVPCLACGGSCKVVVVVGGGARERCGACNENGLVRCPACL